MIISFFQKFRVDRMVTGFIMAYIGHHHNHHFERHIPSLHRSVFVTWWQLATRFWCFLCHSQACGVWVLGGSITASTKQPSGLWALLYGHIFLVMPTPYNSVWRSAGYKVSHQACLYHKVEGTGVTTSLCQTLKQPYCYHEFLVFWQVTNISIS